MKLNYIAKINKEKFNEVNSKKLKLQNNKKFNIRIKQEDLLLIDYIANKQNITRSSIINKIIDELLKHELDSIEELDARLLVATTADEFFYENQDEPGRWTAWSLRHQINSLKENYLRWNYPEDLLGTSSIPEGMENKNSEQFDGILSRLSKTKN